MDWIKVKVKHAEYDFATAPAEVFKAWIMLMIFVAATERVPTKEQLAARLGKENYENLVKYIDDNKLTSLNIIIEKVIEDVSHVSSKRNHDRKYMSKYRCKGLRKPPVMVMSEGKIREDKIREDNKRVGAGAPITNEVFLSSLKMNPAYKHINVDAELGKMDAWIVAHPGRQKTRRFIVNWLNKIEIPFNSKPSRRIPA